MYFEAVELLIGWPSPITLVSYYLLRLKAKAIDQVTDTVWHNSTLVLRSRGAVAVSNDSAVSVNRVMDFIGHHSVRALPGNQGGLWVRMAYMSLI
ncbi:MAG: hypothetical protein KZQ96_19985 [Candidatus Thiodiazotropha sp. (ex Lucinoma borealis)]|nr:hypothetical protein [Candidatus Thiodiazotropha sp. (ex Lucinoma borealis)]